MKFKMILLTFVPLFLVTAAILVWRSRGGRPELDDTNLTPAIANPNESQGASIAVNATLLPNTWSRFRGPNGVGISDDKGIPTQWSDSQNLAWKTKLPGAGASSPVVTDQCVFVTSYSGYGLDPQNPGDVNELKRHLSCIERNNGVVLWTKTVDSEHREDPYQGAGLPEHGYATNTPVSDGRSVYVFFGKSGVIAFDLEGNQKWHVSVGTGSGNRGWGTAASLVLLDNLVIVNAAEESKRLVALDKETGQVVWESNAATLELCYSTPALVPVDASRTDLVIAVPGEVWGLNPRNGKLAWYAKTSLTGNLSPSIIVDGSTVFAFGGYRSSGSTAIKVGGNGDVTNTHVSWTSRNSSYISTPVLLDHRLHWFDDRGMYYCTNAESGELIHRARVRNLNEGGHPVYASPIVIHGLIYIQSRHQGIYVLRPADELQIISQNQFESDPSSFNATPAVDAGQLFLRSDHFLYCVSQ